MDSFVIANVLPGQLNALVKNIMKQTGVTDPNEAVRIINAGEAKIILETTPTEKDVFFFSVTSNGRSGKEWITRLLSMGYRLESDVKSVLLSKKFIPTTGVTTKVAVILGKSFANAERTTINITSRATSLNLSNPNAEVACLIREKFSDKELKNLGIHWLVVMHHPIKNMMGDRVVLGADTSNGGYWFRCSPVLPNFGWLPEHGWLSGGGFAFAASQTLSF